MHISAAIRRGLIEASPAPGRVSPPPPFPRPFAAASLKRPARVHRLWTEAWISAAIRRGLIEAGSASAAARPSGHFRGHSPRPH